MHVVVTVNAAWNIWNFRKPVIASLLGQGHRTTVLAPVDDHVLSLEAVGCQFVELAMDSKGLNPVSDLSLLRRLRREFERLRPDLVLSYTIKNNIYGALAAKPLGIPLIANVSGLGTAFLSGGALQFVAERLYSTAFRALPTVFFQNSEDLDLFVSRKLVRADQARVLPGSGIDLERFSPAAWPQEGEAPVFLMIARLLRDKGVIEFVEAARGVKSRYPLVRFQLLGAVDADNRTAIDRATVEDWHASGVIEYLGTSDDVREQIAAAHCIVLPSYREGAPRTLIEAAAMARPVIASDVPGCRSVVDEGRSGLLCEVGSAQSLADACKRFIVIGRGLQLQMGQAGRAKMEREYDEGIVVQAYQRAIEDALR